MAGLLWAVLVVGAPGVGSPVSAGPRLGLGFVAVQPARLFDGRAGTPTVDTLGAGSGPVVGGASATVVVLGRGGVPLSGVGAVVLNVTALEPTVSTFVSVFAAGVSRPDAPVLNPDPSLSAVASVTLMTTASPRR